MMKKVTIIILLAAMVQVFCAPLKAQEEGRRWNVTAFAGKTVKEVIKVKCSHLGET